MKKRFALIMLTAAVLMSGCAGRTQAQTKDEATKGAEASTAAGETAAAGEKTKVKLQIKDYGTITMELDSEYAPITVDNFLTLVKDGFYDGLTFHRIIDGFMIQGGDPEGTGMGGAEKKIKGEFSSNGVDNPLSHTRGAVSMARSQNKNSASSQFFIVHEDSPHLDGDYAVFGYVTEGMDVVDKICESVKVEDGNGTVKKENQPVIEKMEVVE